MTRNAKKGGNTDKQAFKTFFFYFEGFPKSILITELKIGFLPQDLTLVQSELVVLGVLGYSRTQHTELDDEGVLSVSGHCHLVVNVQLGKL